MSHGNVNNVDDGVVNLTVVSADDGRTDTLSLSATGTTLRDLLEFASAVLGVDGASALKDGRPIHEAGNATTASTTLRAAGLRDGDLVSVSARRPDRTTTSSSSSTSGLDFSALLSNANHNNNNTNTNTAPTFHIPGLASAAASPTSPVEWDGMTLDDAIERNPRPDCLVRVLLSERHPNLWKELNHHSPLLARELRDAADPAAAWRANVLRGGLSRALDASAERDDDREMTARLRRNPNDGEARRHFDERARRRDVETSYRRAMETFPESMGRVLMLYVDAQVNGVAVQAFVDSGAQSTIMSASAAARCGLLRLLDDRFAGVAVGVGTGKIAGRVHLAPLTIKGRHFPCTITVMEDNGEGLGDKNMEFLFGLDMLKRHRCRIDLARNVLAFGEAEDGVAMETPFLHEKDLDETKGGTKGFDAEKANEDLERAMLQAQRKQERSDTDEPSDMDVDVNKDKHYGTGDHAGK